MGALKITLLFNAGLALETEEAMLLVDAPNRESPPFFGLPDEEWRRILERQPPYDKVCGFWFTHDHPDHFDRERMEEYVSRWPKTKVFLPNEHTEGGHARMGPFTMEYSRLDHAPIPDPPPHVVTWIETGEGSVYLAADAALDVEAHRSFLRGRRAKAAVWNSMYLSRPDTRQLMSEAAERNFICHMPAQRPDGCGLWRKLERNLERFSPELEHVTVWDAYPTQVDI